MKYYFESVKMLDFYEVNRAVEQAFAEHGSGNVQIPQKNFVTFPQGDFRTIPANIPSMDLAGEKMGMSLRSAGPQTSLRGRHLC